MEEDEKKKQNAIQTGKQNAIQTGKQNDMHNNIKLSLYQISIYVRLFQTHKKNTIKNISKNLRNAGF